MCRPFRTLFAFACLTGSLYSIEAGGQIVAEPAARPAHVIAGAPDEPIEEAVRSPARPAGDLERDASSRPAEVLSFIGIGPGMAILDMNAGAGYYAELLARVVGESGSVIAHNHPGAVATLTPEVLELRYGSGRLAGVEQLFARYDELDLAPASLDAILMSMVSTPRCTAERTDS